MIRGLLLRFTYLLVEPLEEVLLLVVLEIGFGVQPMVGSGYQLVAVVSQSLLVSLSPLVSLNTLPVEVLLLLIRMRLQ
jgi:hypothetical protein